MIAFPALNLAGFKAKALKWGLIILALLGYGYGALLYGKALQRAETEKDTVRVLESELDKSQQRGKKNADKAEETGRRQATMDAKMAKALEDLNEAIERARDGRSASCDLTPDELRALEAIYNSYQ